MVVGEERALAIPKLLYTFPATQVIILDDAFQHRKVKCDLNILLVDYHKPIFKDYILPVGRLRESRWGAKRADIVIITKCPPEPGYKMEYYNLKLKRYLKRETPVFFTGLKYASPVPVNHNIPFEKHSRIIAVSGIANPAQFHEYLSKEFYLEEKFEFNDHHNYQENDFRKILAIYHKINDESTCVVITEKDMVKWIENQYFQLLQAVKVYYLPIEIYFLKDEDLFHKHLLNVIK